MRIIGFILGILVAIGHIWTTVIGFQEGGFLGGILSLILPFLSEIYWIIKMIGVNTPYVVYTILCIVLFLPLAKLFTSR